VVLFGKDPGSNKIHASSKLLTRLKGNMLVVTSQTSRPIPFPFPSPSFPPFLLLLFSSRLPSPNIGNSSCVGKRSYTPPQCGSPIRSTFSSKVAPYLLEGATHQNRIMEKELWSQPITSNSYGCDPRYIMLYIPIYLMVYIAEAHCNARHIQHCNPRHIQDTFIPRLCAICAICAHYK
jgi:hypothetical protein